MKRRDFLKKSSLATIGGLALTSFASKANILREEFKNKRTKNIIFMVSDGMSSGTLTMADIYCKRIYGRSSNWMKLYENNLAQRGLMDMASANAIVTDSAAASSSWGGGMRVNNGSINISPEGKELLPILQKFKKKGKKVGCVTTVPITHATPAGFCVYNKSRNAMSSIAKTYSELNFDVFIGSGNNYFSSDKRKDKKDIYKIFREKGFAIARTKQQMNFVNETTPLLAVFEDEAVPYNIDHINNNEQKNNIPTLAEMTAKAIHQMKNHTNGFVMQVEAGKVDWAAHGNDIAGLLYDQIAFDDAIDVAIDFAKKDGNTLVIITSDHGNANPGLVYGGNTTNNFDFIQNFTHSNEWILQGIEPTDSIAKVKERIAESCGGWRINEEQAKEILSYYNKTKTEKGIYNPKHLPFKYLSEIQSKITSVVWASMDHSSDYTELTMYGPGSEKMKPFMKNTDIHNFLLNVTETENNF